MRVPNIVIGFGFLFGVAVFICVVIQIVSDAQCRTYDRSLGPNIRMEDGTYHDPRCAPSGKRTWNEERDGPAFRERMRNEVAGHSFSTRGRGYGDLECAVCHNSKKAHKTYA